MQFKKETNLPPNLDPGTILHNVTRVERSNFILNGQETKGLRVFQQDGKEYRTSSGVLIEQFEKFFELHPNETLDNAKVVQPRGKKYLTLEEA